jgi:hypothetical protein
MKNRNEIQKRYLRDGLPVRLGGIAANLSRVKSFAEHEANREAAASLLEESKFFIEWTAGEAGPSIAEELVQLQLQLSLWQRAWEEIWQDPENRREAALASGKWSQRVLEMSGLLG